MYLGCLPLHYEIIFAARVVGCPSATAANERNLLTRKTYFYVRGSRDEEIPFELYFAVLGKKKD